ncbi:extracellular solute-binding protein [Microbacterium pumilum]|uniref:Sugar ABC transporter substrate-binding protein n=1 Tax=Microbacterium pumilum TaxID=344165 RepID=A0ABN2RNG1_9MICO
MSKHPRIRLAASAFALTTAVVLAGCTAGSGAGGASADGVTTVTVMYATNEFTPEYIAQFEDENPDIKIEFLEYDENRLNAMLTAGDPPDFVRGSPSANLFARGLAAPLDDYIASSDVIKEGDLLPVNDLWRWDGTKQGDGDRYGIVKDFSPDNTLWQNEALFEAAGVEPLSTTEPADWDDVLATAEALKPSGVEFPLGIEWQWGIAGILTAMVQQQGAEVFSEDLTEIDLDTPEALRAIQWFIDYGKAEVGPTSLNPLADNQDAPSYLAEKMAVTKDGFWFGGNLASEDGATVAATSSLAPAPTFGERISPVLGGVGAWIPEGSNAKDQAWKVMEYFMAGQPAIDRASSGWGLPSLESLWENIPAEEPYQQQAIELAKEEVQYIVPLQDSPYITATQWNGILDREIQAGIQGTKTAEQIADAVQTEVNVLLAQGKDQLG